MNPVQKTAQECLQTSDALRLVAVAIDRLDRAGHPSVQGSDEATIVHCTAPIVADALCRLAERLGRTETNGAG